jgi:hypothetical protein
MSSDEVTSDRSSDDHHDRVAADDMLDELCNANDQLDGQYLRRKLKFFFMDPMQKWRVRRQFPFKLALQIFKIVFVTLQVHD